MKLSLRTVNVIAVAVPFVAVLVAIVLLWQHGVSGIDLGVLAFMYLVTGLGATVGFHRLFSHRAFETTRGVRVALAILGSMTVEGPPITWVADHRKHHAFADEDGDPHSPHLEAADGWRGMVRGLWHAHVGWLLGRRQGSDPLRFAPDLVRDPAMRSVSRHFIAIAIASLAIPFLLGLALTQSLYGGLTALLWGGLVRIFLFHHVSWSVNSVGHFFGRRAFETDDHSTNVMWLAVPSLGDSWHNNHHAFPTAAHHGIRWWQVDIAGATIALLKRIGLARDVIEAPPRAPHAPPTPDAPRAPLAPRRSGRAVHGDGALTRSGGRR